ncbi:MAG: IS701 family transposase [Sedimentisphaerales bacterium]
MDAKQIKQLEPMLSQYLRHFDDCFGRIEPVERLKAYITGQLSDLQRKSIEPMADAAGLPPRNLQQFLSLHKWDQMRMRDTVERIVANEHRHPCSIGIVDETGHPKKGDKTPGVQRQWCGTTGKKDNCVVTVHLNYTAGDFHCLLDGELFLPESWAQDKERCKAAGIPEQMTYRPKWQIALELRERAVANGIRFEWLGADEGYGKVPEFLFELDDRGQRYVVEVPAIFTGWLVEPKLLHKEHHVHRKGRKRRFPRLKAKSPSASNVRQLMLHSPVLRKIPWEKFYIKDTTKGPVVWEAKAARFYLQRDGLPTRSHWLIIARNVENPQEVKFFVSNAPDGTPLEVLLHVGFSRWHVERCFEDEKRELGLSHFEVRNYTSLRRHLIITAVSYLFLAKVHQLWRGEKSGVHGLPDSYGFFGAGSVLMVDRKGQRTILGENSRNSYLNATAYRSFSPLPYSEKTPAIA